MSWPRRTCGVTSIAAALVDHASLRTGAHLRIVQRYALRASLVFTSFNILAPQVAACTLREARRPRGHASPVTHRPRTQRCSKDTKTPAPPRLVTEARQPGTTMNTRLPFRCQCARCCTQSKTPTRQLDGTHAHQTRFRANSRACRAPSRVVGTLGRPADTLTRPETCSGTGSGLRQALARGPRGGPHICIANLAPCDDKNNSLRML